MDKQNKEFPSFLGHESAPQPQAETPESAEGLIVEQPLSPEEKQELEHSLTEQQETIMAPSPAEAAMVEPAESLSAAPAPDTDHAGNHLKADNKIETSSDAHNMLNDLLNGSLKP